jgi:hypothetical protein
MFNFIAAMPIKSEQGGFRLMTTGYFTYLAIAEQGATSCV